MKFYKKLLILPMLLLLGGCGTLPGWETTKPEPTIPAITVDIAVQCASCVQAQGGSEPTGTAPLAMTFQANVTLRDPAQESVIVYNWDFGDGTKQEGFRISHTFEQTGLYQVGIRVVTSKGEQAEGTLRVHVNPQPAPPPPVMQVDKAEGEICSFTRILPPEVHVGDIFTVEIDVTAKQAVQVAILEDKVWFPQFHVIEDPEAIWLQMAAGQTNVLKYHVKLIDKPSQTWMQGELNCNAGGFSNPEILNLKSVLNVAN
jgi:hypothetical protein